MRVDMRASAREERATAATDRGSYELIDVRPKSFGEDGDKKEVGFRIAMASKMVQRLSGDGKQPMHQFSAQSSIELAETATMCVSDRDTKIAI